MTFTKKVKNELITVPLEMEEMLAEFSAFLNLACEFHISNKQKMIDFKTTNPTVSRRFLLLTKSLYQSEVELLTKEQQRFSKKPIVILRIISEVEKIILEHSYLDEPIENIKLLTQGEKTKRSFLRGAFLVAGSINHPKTAEYHLEIFAESAEQIILIQSIMNYFDFNARITKRRNGYIVYLKDAETISDFMQLIGAQNSVFEFEDIRIKRDFNNSINRVINCELANEKKTIVAAKEQLEDIELIESYELKSEIDDKMKETIYLRKKYPYANLRELTEFYKEEYGDSISRSGINHRLNKIKQLADKLRKEAKDD